MLLDQRTTRNADRRVEPTHAMYGYPRTRKKFFERLDHVIGCGHVSGLLMRPNMTAGRYGDTRTWRKSDERAVSSMACIAFPDPDLTDHLPLPFVDLLTRLTFP
jgi:hypothetical protein